MLVSKEHDAARAMLMTYVVAGTTVISGLKTLLRATSGYLVLLQLVSLLMSMALVTTGACRKHMC